MKRTYQAVKRLKGVADIGKDFARKADIKIKHCRCCGICWEVDYQALRNYSPEKKLWQRNQAYIYYEDFPTYGKPKEDCPKCLAESS